YLYVGDLGNNESKQDLEDAFGYYGQLRNVWVARNPHGFAFLEFEGPRDAEDAVKGLDGRTICGRRARVELSSGKGGGRYRGPPSRSRGRPSHPDDRCYECGVMVTMLEMVQDIREVVVVADVDPGQDLKAVDAVEGLVLAALGPETVPGTVPVLVPLWLREVAAVLVLMTIFPDLGSAPGANKLLKKMDIMD
ncbi:hypothetical protein WA026_016660, partial [Henosepilachna vigintioctopunctata]